MASHPRVSSGSWIAVFGILAREGVRSALFPLRAVISMVRNASERRRTLELLAGGGPGDAGAAHAARARNDDARARFRALLGPATPRRVFVSCAEHSGEGHALAFVRALRSEVPDVDIAGFGGGALERDGVRLLENLVDDAVMGLFRVLGRLPFYMRVVGAFRDWVRTERPDVVVVFDSPGIHMVLAEVAKSAGCPVLYFICPQYWAWARWRLRRFRKAVDGTIAILPFEPPMFEACGVPAGFAGNPLVARVPELAPEPREPVLAVLPGSRRAEIERNLPHMLALLRAFHVEHPEMRAVIPHQNPKRLARIREIVAEHGGIEGLTFHDGGVFDVLPRARLALVKSGTSTMQAALCRTPQVVVYRLSGELEMWLSQFLSTPWIAAPNLVLGRAAVPEFLFRRDSTWRAVYRCLLELWPDGLVRNQQLAAADEVRRRLQGTGSVEEAVRWLLPDR